MMKPQTFLFVLLAGFATGTQHDISPEAASENALEGSAISTGKTATSRPFLDSTKKPSIPKSNLRASDSAAVEFAVQQESTELQEVGDRNLQQAATVTLVNNCGYDAHLAIYYTSGNWIYGRGFYFVRGNGSSFTLAHQVTSSELHIYGTHATTGSAVWDAPSSEYCFARNDCFSRINIGSLGSGSVRYNICGDNITPAPPPANAPAPSSGTDAQWLQEHNTRRTRFYTEQGLTDLPLKWSASVATSAKNYATKLLGSSATGCNIEHGYQGDDYGGENIGANWGSGGPRSPATIMNAWYDAEINLSNFFQRLHATQVVFRSSKYVGCGDAEKTMPNGQKCYIQVCRYIAAGNCFPSGQDDWLIDVKSDTAAQRCGGPQCPAEGCF